MGKNPENLEKANKSETYPSKDRGDTIKKLGKTAVLGSTKKQ